MIFEKQTSLLGDNRPQSAGGVLRGIPDPQDFQVQPNTDGQTIFLRRFGVPSSESYQLPSDISAVELLPVSDYDAAWLQVQGENIPQVSDSTTFFNETINDGGGTAPDITTMSHKLTHSSPWYRGKNMPTTIKLVPYYAPATGSTPTGWTPYCILAARLWRNPRHVPLPTKPGPFQKVLAVGNSGQYVPCFGRERITIGISNPAGNGTVTVSVQAIIFSPLSTGAFAATNVMGGTAATFTCAAGATAIRDMRDLTANFGHAHFVNVISSGGTGAAGVGTQNVFVDVRANDSLT